METLTAGRVGRQASARAMLESEEEICDGESVVSVGSWISTALRRTYVILRRTYVITTNHLPPQSDERRGVAST